MVAHGKDVRIFTWRGDWINDTLALMLGGLGMRASNEGLSLVAFDVPADRVFDAFLDIADSPPPTGEEVAAAVKNKYRGKYDGLLSDALLCRNFGSSELDVAGAIATAHRLICSNDEKHLPHP